MGFTTNIYKEASHLWLFLYYVSNTYNQSLLSAVYAGKIITSQVALSGLVNVFVKLKFEFISRFSQCCLVLQV